MELEPLVDYCCYSVIRFVMEDYGVSILVILKDTIKVIMGSIITLIIILVINEC